MSQVFTITWVGDQSRDWETDKGQFTEYKIALAGYDPSENDPDAGKTVAWSRRRGSQAPAPGDEVFGHVEVKSYDWGNKYLFKKDQAQDGQQPARFTAPKGVESNGGGPTGDDRSRRIERQHSQEMALRLAAIKPGVLDGHNLDQDIETIAKLTDRFAADLEPKADPLPGPEPSKPVIEDVTPPKVAAPAAADDDIPF